jgi:hypothetical protein
VAELSSGRVGALPGDHTNGRVRGGKERWTGGADAGHTVAARWRVLSSSTRGTCGFGDSMPVGNMMYDE